MKFSCTNSTSTNAALAMSLCHLYDILAEGKDTVCNSTKQLAEKNLTFYLERQTMNRLHE